VYDDEEATEMPRAYIVPTHLSKLVTVKAREDFARSVALGVQTKVARHKYLRGGVVLTDSIPKSSAGKILRKQLRHRVKHETDQVVFTPSSKL